jgi:hypothetical protein
MFRDECPANSLQILDVLFDGAYHHIREQSTKRKNMSESNTISLVSCRVKP